VACLVYTPEGSDLVTNGSNRGRPAVLVYALDRLDCVHAFMLPGGQARHLIYSPNGDTLAVANAKQVLLLPPDLSAPRLTLAHPKQVNAVAFTPDGRRMLTTCTDKLVRVWDAATCQLVTSYDWNVGVTNAIAVAPDGLTAAVSGQSGRVVLFDLDG
jgi:WD40 repeat protein